MDLSNNKWINAELAAELRRDGWTLELLATAGVKTLTAYSGVGKLTAQRIINESQRVVNEHKAFEAGQLEHQALAGAHRIAQPPHAAVEYPAAEPFQYREEPPVQRSVRVQRLIDLNKSTM